MDTLVPKEVLAEHAVSLDELEKGQVCLGNLICNFLRSTEGKTRMGKIKNEDFKEEVVLHNLYVEFGSKIL